MSDAEEEIWVAIRGDLSDIKKSMKSLGKDVDKAEKKTVSKFGKIGKSATDMGVKIARASAVAVAAMAASATAVTLFGSASARSLELASDRLGLTATRLMDLEDVASSYGVTSDRLRDSMKDLSERIADAAVMGGSYQEFLSQINLDSKELIGIPVDQQLLRVADGISALNTEAQQNLVAVNLMGDAGFEMLGMLKQGSTEIENQVGKWRDLRGEMSELDIKRAATLNQSLGEMSKLWEDLSIMIAAEVGPAIVFIIEEVKKLVQESGGAGEIMAKLGGVIETAMSIGANAVEGFRLLWNGTIAVVSSLGLAFWNVARDVVTVVGTISAKWDAFVNFLEVAWENKSDAIALIWVDLQSAVFSTMTDLVKFMTEKFAQLGFLAKEAGFDEIGDQMQKAAGSVEIQMMTMNRAVQRNLETQRETILASNAELKSAYERLGADVEVSTPFLDAVIDRLETTKEEAVGVIDEILDAGAGGESAGDRAVNAFRIFQDDLNTRLQAQIDHDAEMALLRDEDEEKKKLEEEAERTRIQGHVDAIRKAEVDQTEQTAALWESSWRGKAKITSDVLGQVSTLMQSESRKMFEVGKAAAMGQAVIDTISSAQASYKSLAGIPVVGPGLGIAAAAAALAAGTVRVQQIRSQSFGGGGSPSGGSGGAAAGGGAVNAGGAPAAPAAPRSVTNITLRGDHYSGDQVRGLIGAVNDQLDDGSELNVRSS